MNVTVKQNWDKAFPSLNPDFRYLITKVPSQSEWYGDAKYVAFVLRQFGEKNVTEALRRIDRTTAVSKRYFYGICKAVSLDAKS